MANPTQMNQVFSQLTGKAVEAFALWADANRKMMQEFVDLSANTAKEGLRLYSEMQAAAMRAARDETLLLQRNLIDSVAGAQNNGFTARADNGTTMNGFARVRPDAASSARRRGRRSARTAGAR